MDARHRARYREIATVLRRHSFGFLAGLVGAGRRTPFRRASPDAAPDGIVGPPEHLRLALEELGPTFIKFGQLLSTRSDLVPPAYADELAKLQDAAPPVPVEQVRAVIRSELGADADEMFASFEDQPLASASIGQAHAAVLDDGTEVVVKVRRPGAVAQVQQDLEIMRNLADRASRTWSLARDHDARGLAEEFAQTLLAELDYLQEGRNAERFAEDFEFETDVAIPRVFWDYTTSRVLTLERMTGLNVGDAAALDAAGVDRKRVARRGAEIVLKMTFEDRFFHADPHPGNLFVQPDGTIALIDFGMVGEIDESLRDQLGALFVALVRGDPGRLASALIDLSPTSAGADRELLQDDLADFLSRYRLDSLRETPFARMIAELFGILRRHRLRLPREMALLFKALLVIEGLALRLDPEFRLGDTLRPYAQRLARERLSATVLAKRIARATADLGELALDMPGALRRLLEHADEGGIQVHLRAAELEPLVGRAERIGNRLVAGMISAAFITGVGSLVASERRWRSWEGVMLGTGLGVIGSLGGYLALTMRRTGSRRRR
ncbi:AarF/ABC1/UbiB kinase family protein [Agromyces binzhouensis]|uniref:AarF/ABC1/UbiB kinase family protein n=1 Tax=Agromyces binzhouensis TaxID=1817495 RepID=A0A4Q2JJ33_9MICO|nr:AarF/ABC1/UbiB kinase family protein [Agromyces binzhouensis]